VVTPDTRTPRRFAPYRKTLHGKKYFSQVSLQSRLKLSDEAFTRYLTHRGFSQTHVLGRLIKAVEFRVRHRSQKLGIRRRWDRSVGSSL
jgi:hypothetical protein